jgi:hypothetical protein
VAAAFVIAMAALERIAATTRNQENEAAVRHIGRCRDNSNSPTFIGTGITWIGLSDGFSGLA